MNMRVGKPVDKPKTAKRKDYMPLYAKVLALANGQALPVQMDTMDQARRFWINVCAADRPGWKRGIGGIRRGRIVYLYRKKGGKPDIDADTN